MNIIKDFQRLGAQKKIIDKLKISNEISKNRIVDELRAENIERNKSWRKEFENFKSNNSRSNGDGKLNNKFYRKSFSYDIVIPKNIYDELLLFYKYALEQEMEEDILFFDKYFDHLVVFLYAVTFYREKYPSNLYSRLGKTPLHVKFIYSLVGREYAKVTEFLQKIGLLQIDYFYVAGYADTKCIGGKRGVCRHYKVTKEPSEIGIVHRVTSRIIVNKIYSYKPKKSNDIIIPENKPSKKTNGANKDKTLNEWFSSYVDFDKSIYSNKNKDFDGFAYIFSRLKDGVNKFEDFKIGRDDFGNRMYHPILNINKRLREHVTINGSLDNVVIDIDNSHPYFFSCLFDEDFLDNVSHILTDEEYKLFKDVSLDDKHKESISLLQKITSSGNYYSYLSEHMKTENVKDVNMYFFYGKINKMNEVYQLFNKNFKFINYVKAAIIKIGGFKRMCQILQRVESYVVIDRIFMRLISEGINAIPLHDAMMCNRINEDRVREIFAEEIHKLKIKRLPSLDKAEDISDDIKRINEINFNLFINKNRVFEELNVIIKACGIKSRVFKEDMLDKSKNYIDEKFENVRELIPDDIADRYYELRLIVESGQFDFADHSEIFNKYVRINLTKRKWFSQDVVGTVKINPIEYYNYIYGTNYKTRLRESNYIYS